MTPAYITFFMTNKNQQIQDLIEHNDELENYFRNTIIPQLFVDGELNLKKYTPPAMKQFNLSKADVGKPISDIKDNFRFPSIIDNIQQVIESNEILEKEIQTTDLRWYQMNIIPYVTIKDNKTNGVILTFVEITDRIKILKELEQLVKDHEILLDTISHDFKTPLSSLIIAFQIIKELPPNKADDIQKLLLIQENSIIKLQNLIADLTDTHKQENTYIAKKELLDLENILEDVRLTLHDEIAKSGAIIHTDIQASQVSFPRIKLRSIVHNLVINAIKYRSPDRKLQVWITTRLEGEFIILSVKDNGVGIDASQHESVFSKYVRLSSHIQGTGIGLYLVKEHVTKAGGKITLHSELGKGSEFIIHLKAH